MPTIFQPITSVKLTNVAVVRFNSHGKRFEIACYRNKIMDYRSGLEKDLSEVLQTDRIFTNVSKGEFSNTKDLEKAFGTRNEEEIAKIILEKGTMQVSDREREQQLHNTLSQVATWIANNCVHPESGRPYTASQIKHQLEHNYNIQPHKAMKKQYLDAVKYLKTIIPIERAKMELSLQFPNDQESVIDEALNRMDHTLVNETKQKDTTLLLLQVDPSLYRDLDELAKSVNGRLEISQHVVVVQEGDIDLEKEVERKQQHLGNNAHTHKATQQHDSQVVDDEEVEAIQEKLQGIRMEKEESEDESDEDFRQMSRKEQKKAQKKTKKAKRRVTDEEESAQDFEEERQKQEQRLEKSMQSEAAQRNAEAQSIDGAKSCNTCGGSFATAALYRAHFRSDWHRFNQKLKLKGVAPVSEEEFKLCDEGAFFGNDSL